MPAGERINFHVSSDSAYTLSVSRPTKIGDASGDVVLHEFPASQPLVQPIQPGSYISIARSLPANEVFAAATFEVWVKPWQIGRRQTVLGQFDYPHSCGYGVFLNERGQVEFYVGSGAEFESRFMLSADALETRKWHHIVGTWDGLIATLWIDARKSASREVDVKLQAGVAPLRFGACAEEGVVDRFLDADIAMPVVYSRTLSGADIKQRFAQRGLRVPADRFVLGCWPLAEQRGDVIRDSSGHERTGQIVNHATWMINGPAFRPENVGLYDDLTPPYDPKQDLFHGDGIRFARDDLYDCRWSVTHQFDIPEEAKSGIYVARLRYEKDGVPLTYDVTFVVTKAANAEPAPILVLCATSTWLAYASSPFAENTSMNATWPRRGAGLKNSHEDAPSYNTYTRHSGGQPTYHAGLRMPWPNASPDARYDPVDADFAQWTRLELHLHFWLDREGYDYDVISDFDLHKCPEILNQYKTVIINGHSEYWTIPAYDGLDRYLRRGGTALVLSGNSLCSRVSFDANLLVMEQRKTHPAEARFVPGSTVEFPGGDHGEQYHSDDGLRGGELRRSGRSSAHVIGLDTAGWGFAEGDDFGVYKVAMPDHFLFKTPNSIGVTRGQSFGHAVDGGLPRAVGHEWDLTFHTLKKMTHRVPDGQVLPPDHADIQVIAHGVREKPGSMDAYLDFFYQDAPSLDGLSCEMIYWERPEGGTVFNAGAVGASWVLGSDPIFEQLLVNVLHRFGIPVPNNPSTV